MKKLLWGVCLIAIFVFAGCASGKPAFVYDPEIPEDQMSFLFVPGYVKVTQFGDKAVEWIAPALSMGPAKVGVPSGEFTFIIDTVIVGDNPAGIPYVRGQSYTQNFVAGKGYQLINRNGKIALVDLSGQPSANQSGNSRAQSEPKNEPAPPENKPEDLGWAIGQFTNEWGDKTGDYFMTFDKSVTGSATGRRVGNGRLRVSGITVSEIQGLTFRLAINQYDDRWDRAEIGSEISIVLRYGNNEEVTIEGKRFTGSAVGLALNDALVNILSREETINFRITTDEFGIYRYQFDFKPDNFTKAYEQLKTYSKN